MRRHAQTGRPPGTGSFVENLETMLDLILQQKKAGRSPKSEQK